VDCPGQPESYTTRRVDRSSRARVVYASRGDAPHMSGNALRLPHTAGRSGERKIAQRESMVRWMQRTPAGFPSGMPGMGDEIEGAIQHAPQPERHSTLAATRDLRT
jgi:hypothetical protein